MPNFRRSGATASRRGAVVAAAALGLLVTAPQPAFAASVRVSPTTGLDPSGQTITVRGSGFDPARNNKVGVYVVVGPRSPDWATNANVHQAATWVHPGGSGGGGQAPMSASGGFSVSLSVKAGYTDGDGKKVDCLKTQCYVLTMAAHGSPDRSQDTATPISFEGSGGGGPNSGAGSGGPGGSGGAAGSTGSGGSGQGGAAAGSGASAPASPGGAGGPSGSPGATATPDGAALAGVSPASAFEQNVSGGEAGSPWPFWATTAAALLAVFAVRAVLRRRSGRYARRRGARPAP
ncbi:hypothetical protein ACN3XK_25725 [Actinomadura welshii]